jgi:membrane protease YdiL (CAAX protease family)
MIENNAIKQHSIGKSVFLHLFPGILASIAYFLLIQPLKQHGYPSLMALILAIVFILVPVEFSYLLYQGKRKNGRYSIQGLISYQNKIPAWQYLIWLPLLFIVLGLVFTLFKPIDTFLQQSVFVWWPVLQNGLEGEYSKQALIITYVLLFIFGALIGPIVEELYFRGYLLPRMKYAGKWAPMLHSFLFAFYHFFTPWMIITRTIAMLPLIYAVQRKNIYLSIVVHVLINTIDVIVGIAFITSM